ncbi:MAG: cyanophycinase [Thermomicrobiales bacterium]
MPGRRLVTDIIDSPAAQIEPVATPPEVAYYRTLDQIATGGPGPIMAIGGAEDKVRNKLILTAFHALAGGLDARIAIVPTASSIEDAGERYKALFLEMGAASADVISLSDRADANEPSAAEIIRGATGVFMTGGNQMRLAAIVGGSLVAKAVHERQTAGAVIAGTSAGASILSSHMVAFGSSGASPKMRMAQMTAGFGLIPDTIVDQHFRQRDRFGRLMALVAASPALLGVGVDEDTAAMFRNDGMLEVLGRQTVTIVDGTHMESDVFRVKGHQPITVANAIVHILASGRQFDTRSRKMIVA